MRFFPLAALAASLLATAAPAQQLGPDGKPPIPGQNVNGLRVYLRAGLKTHAEGQHDYPQFLSDWSKILNAHGAVVDGSFHAPSDEELRRVDVMVMYKGDAGYMTADERAALEAFIRRGGGLVLIHDAMCGPDPKQFASYVGGAKKHGEVNYTLGTEVTYRIADRASPLMAGMTPMTLYDESFYKMTWAPAGTHVLATAKISDTPSARTGGGVGQDVPQIWIYEHKLDGGQPARAFVWMQGHTYTNLQNYQIERMLLRAISWAGKHPVNELVDYVPPAPPERPAGVPGRR